LFAVPFLESTDRHSSRLISLNGHAHSSDVSLKSFFNAVDPVAEVAVSQLSFALNSHIAGREFAFWQTNALLSV
jgi:hypothetical protein